MEDKRRALLRALDSLGPLCNRNGANVTGAHTVGDICGNGDSDLRIKGLARSQPKEAVKISLLSILNNRAREIAPTAASSSLPSIASSIGDGAIRKLNHVSILQRPTAIDNSAPGTSQANSVAPPMMQPFDPHIPYALYQQQPHPQHSMPTGDQYPPQLQHQQFGNFSAPLRQQEQWGHPPVIFPPHQQQLNYQLQHYQQQPQQYNSPSDNSCQMDHQNLIIDEVRQREQRNLYIKQQEQFQRQNATMVQSHRQEATTKEMEQGVKRQEGVVESIIPKPKANSANLLSLFKR